MLRIKYLTCYDNKFDTYFTLLLNDKTSTKYFVKWIYIIIYQNIESTQKNL